MTHEQMIESLTFSADLCVDCTYVNANGVDETVPDDWEGWLPHTARLLFVSAACGGDDVDDLYCEGHTVAPMRACDGCGTTLGGYRFCHTAVAR